MYQLSKVDVRLLDMNGKPPLIECKHCGLTIPKKKRREHLKRVHKISVGLKGWIGKHFRERKWKHGWKKPSIIELE
jgi:DNA-directed RNA polymerase subunit RPC12/RpoP